MNEIGIRQKQLAHACSYAMKGGKSNMKRIVILTAVALALTVLMCGTAFAYTDYIPYLNKQTTGTAMTDSAYALGCFWCHGWDKRATPNTSNQVDVTKVFTAPAGTLGGSNQPAMWTNVYAQYAQPFGPHGGYSDTTDRCKVCHDVHAAAGDKRLLPGNTAADICETCHDFTQGISIYGAVKAQTGKAPMGGHFIYGLSNSEQSTDTGAYIPGGQLGVDDGTYPHTGGTTLYSSASLASKEARLTCTDCHTPHGNTAMRPFKGDRVRLGSAIIVALANIQPTNITKTQFDSTVPGHPVLGDVPIASGTDIATLGDHILIDPDSPIYGKPFKSVTAAGTALGLSLSGADVGDLVTHWRTLAEITAKDPSAPVTGAVQVGGYYVTLERARLTRVASNKLLRDFVNNIDLRDPKFGGTTVSNPSDQYDETKPMWDPVLGGDSSESANAPWVNGQGGGKAYYGSGFCYACHQGRIGNYVGGMKLDTDFDFGADDTKTALNHPTNMKLAYSAVGNIDLTSGYGSKGYPKPYGEGLALSNKGFAMVPVSATTHPDGVIPRQNAPICQQCHEDSRDVETAWNFVDTDKDVPFTTNGNNLIGAPNPGSFIYEGNPQFQNFPHEAQNYRLLVEGGDSNQVGGGNNDDLCLNCHVPSSTQRYDWKAMSSGKDLNGYQE